MTAALDIIVDGRRLLQDCLYGIDEISTAETGSDQVSWTPRTNPNRRFKGGELVEVLFGGYRVWSGNLVEPDASLEQLTATGAWYLAQRFFAFDGSHNTTDVPDTAIDTAITDGLTWTRPTSIRSTSMTIDISAGPARLSDMLDMYAKNNTLTWCVDNSRQVFTKTADTTPTYQTLPIEGGLGYALDDYAASLVGRYINGSAVASSAIFEDTDAKDLHGPGWDVVDLTNRGEISSTSATNILASILAKGKSTPQWTTPIDLAYGEILGAHGTPVALETVSAVGRPLLRVHGGYELAARLNGQKFIDIPMGKTNLAEGVLTITPSNVAIRTITDAINAALSKKSA